MNALTKKSSRAAVLGLLLGAAGAGAHAQTATQPVEKPLSIRLGIYLPTNQSGRDQSGTVLFAAGADYAFTKTAADSPILPLVYVDYAGGSRNGGHMDLYSVGVGVRGYVNRTVGQQVVPYYGVGVGLDFLDAKNRNGNSKTNTQIGGKLQLGAELNSGPFLEAEYQIVPQQSEGIRGDGVNIMVGDRF